MIPWARASTYILPATLLMLHRHSSMSKSLTFRLGCWIWLGFLHCMGFRVVCEFPKIAWKILSMYSILWEVFQSFHHFLKGFQVLKNKESIHLEQIGVCVPPGIGKSRGYAGMESSKDISSCSSTSSYITC